MRALSGHFGVRDPFLMDWFFMGRTLPCWFFKTIYDWARKHVLGSVTVGQTGVVQYTIHTPSGEVCLEIKIIKLHVNLTREHVLRALESALSNFPETLEAEKKAVERASYHKMVREFHAACLNAATAKVKGDKSSQWLEETFLFLRKLKQELSAQGSALGLSEEVSAMCACEMMNSSRFAEIEEERKDDDDEEEED